MFYLDNRGKVAFDGWRSFLHSRVQSPALNYPSAGKLAHTVHKILDNQ